MKNIPIFHILCIALVIACNPIDVDPPEEEVDEFKWLKFINIEPSSDTLILIENYEDRTLAATGTFIETKVDTVIVRGLFSEELEVTITNDTTYRTIANNKLQWISSDNSVVRVSAAGVASPVQGGAASVRASVRGISSNPVQVKVVGLPFLEIDGPEEQAIFLSEATTTTTISGVVEVGALLYIDGAGVLYDEQGNFSETVSLTALGNKVVTVRAVDSLFPQAFTEKTKTYTVYPAEDVTGNWSGTVDDGSTFQLAVVEDPANPGNYIFSGLYNWKVVPFLNVVIIDVPFAGTLDSNGGIRGTFTASQDGAEADVVYLGWLSSPNDASGTVQYAGRYPPYDLNRVNNWTAAKD